jgi:hypothetical protein
MRSSSAQVLSIKTKVLAAVAAMGIVGGVSAAAGGVARAATHECGGYCISVFSSELGTYEQPNFVEAVLDGGGANVGRPVGLKQANKFDSSEDIQPVGGTVSQFYALGLVSREANRRYGALTAVQQRYAPFNVPTALCVGLATVAYQNEGLTLQPCDAATTVWIIDAYPSTPLGYFPIINATTTDFDHPFAMHLPRNEVASGRPLQMQARRLQFLTGAKTLPARQLWGAWRGELN